ncbi:hypothetical protein GGI03_007101 [Coemansia sp. RSA 2337]|nr:hypothetical protein H4S04_000775 [Coemansia sp. S16]KAJ2070348.1 hypothetical protein GGH13_004088 [Coemansia sp. S155-1]KAJ2100115.1 hypothetical protein GGI09_002432 [Coemansia sp. S100]KAJ2449391.1 hypothetical protein GGI03_007101 [Coemansia sp. RSA 2337]
MSKLILYARALPLVTKAMSVTYLVLSLTAILLRLQASTNIDEVSDPSYAASQDPARFLILRPGFIASYPWTIMTSTFVETNLVFLLCGLAGLVAIGSFLERQWGGRSFALFVLVTTMVPALTAAVVSIALYAVRGSAHSSILYATHVGGLAGLVSAFTVGLKQLMPEYSVKLFGGALSFRMNDLPGVYTLVAPIMFTLLGDLGSVLLVNIGFLEAFVYLRFYRREGSLYGDRSEAFAFTTFFPEFVQPLIARLSNALYGAAVACKLITSDEGYRQQNVDLEAAVASDSNELFNLQTPEDSDADRRKAIAAKALDMRLGSAGPPSSAASSSTIAATATRSLLPGQFLVGPPHPVSNIRPVKFYIPVDETPQERNYRELREDGLRRDHEFWLDNNRRFELGKEEFERAVVGRAGGCTVDDLSVYYKQYQVDSYERHLKYNRYVWRRNLALVVPGIRAWWQDVWRRRKRKEQAVAMFSEQGFFDREEDPMPGDAGPAVRMARPKDQANDKIDRRAEKIKSYY